MRLTRRGMFVEIVQVVANRSACKKAKVGALIVKDNRIISMGYNGPVSGIPECEVCESPCNKSVHAEINAIVFAAKAGISVEGAALYCTMSPCQNCANAIINSGIKEVYYIDDYRDIHPIKFLRDMGIKVERRC